MPVSTNSSSASRKSQPQSASRGGDSKSLELRQNSSVKSVRESRVSGANSQKQPQHNSDSESSNSPRPDNEVPGNSSEDQAAETYSDRAILALLCLALAICVCGALFMRTSRDSSKPAARDSNYNKTAPSDSLVDLPPLDSFESDFNSTTTESELNEFQSDNPLLSNSLSDQLFPPLWENYGGPHWRRHTQNPGGSRRENEGTRRRFES